MISAGDTPFYSHLLAEVIVDLKVWGIACKNIAHIVETVNDRVIFNKP